MASRPRRALILARGSNPALRKQRQVLERIERALPRDTQLQIWSDLEIFDSSGSVHEIDAIALGHYGLYLIQVRRLSGPIAGDDLPLVREKTHRLEAFLTQELGREGILVEPLIMLPHDDLKILFPESTRRHVVTTGELLRGLQSGELPGDVAPPTRVPLDAPTAQAIARILGGLRRRVRPGRGSLQQELSLLQRDIVADLTDTVARSPDAVVTPSLEGRGDKLPYRIEEIAAVWVIACVFVRVLEERGYIERRLAGEGIAQRAFLAERSSSTPHDYLMHVLSSIGQYPACDAILGRENRFLWELVPSEDGATALLSFFRRSDDRGRDLYKSEDLWGELYQSISEPLRQANAIVQTPAIVEDLLLDRTLEPAVAELGVSRVRVIDPACGSGTLLVGAFRRLLAEHPSSPSGERALAALDQVHGVDISPAATMITRICLLLAYLDATGSTRLADVPALPLHVVTADSLLSSSDILATRYSVVVCAPPLNVAMEPALRDAYRRRYRSALGRSPLCVPFIERCFQLGDRDGFVGVLVGNSFMKREFGKSLVESVLPAVELTHIIDTAGAYIPGYGVPTMMLLGRSRSPKSETIRVVAGKCGEPIAPIQPREGRVWSSIVARLDQADYEDDYIAVSDVRREQMVTHPWFLGARDVMKLRETLEQDAVRLGALVKSVRMGARSGLDHVYMLPGRLAARLGLESEVLRPLVRGAGIHDFTCSTEEVAIVPGSHELQPFTDQHPRWWSWLWRFRPILVKRRSFWPAAPTPWWAWLQAPPASGRRLRIVAPAIARGPHFALARGDLVASRTARVIEPGDSTSEDELYSWLAFLNSSTASFWMKQLAFSTAPVNGGVRSEEPLYDLSGVLHRVPVPRVIVEPGALRDELVTLARQLERTARDLAATAPDQVIGRWDRSSRESLAESLADAQLRERTLLWRMVCEQEDLDWLVYEAVGLAKAERPIPKASASPEQRPFAWLTDEPPAGLDRRLTEAWRRRRKAGQEHGTLQVLEAAPYKRTFRIIEDDARSRSRGRSRGARPRRRAACSRAP